MTNKWADYRNLNRTEKAVLINEFERKMVSAGKSIFGDDIHKAGALETAAWMLLFTQEKFSAAEVAEAILLCDPQFPYGDFDGKGPYGGCEADTYGNEVIDRAMSMAAQWGQGGYAECFCMHDIGFTKFGQADAIRRVCEDRGLTAVASAVIEAGALAAKAASDVYAFTIMTERRTPSCNSMEPTAIA